MIVPALESLHAKLTKALSTYNLVALKTAETALDTAISEGKASIEKVQQAREQEEKTKLEEQKTLEAEKERQDHKQKPEIGH